MTKIVGLQFKGEWITYDSAGLLAKKIWRSWKLERHCKVNAGSTRVQSDLLALWEAHLLVEMHLRITDSFRPVV
jgi:hypothetical protein